MPKKYRMKRHAVVQPQDPSYKIIPLTRGQNALVDTADYDSLNHWNWCARWSRCTKTFYASRGHRCDGACKTILMHAEILGSKTGKYPDHRNHDTLDNRRQNLREATRTQNAQNRKIKIDNTSGFKGVYWHKIMGKWTATIRVNGKRYMLGYFATLEDAAEAYDEAAEKYFGEFAVLNFPTP